MYQKITYYQYVKKQCCHDIAVLNNIACADCSVDVFHFQELVQRAIDETERAVRMVNELSLFATNEDVEELATSDLRFHLTSVYTVQ